MRGERQETRDERQETRGERRETRDERRETRDDRQRTSAGTPRSQIPDRRFEAPPLYLKNDQNEPNKSFIMNKSTRKTNLNEAENKAEGKAPRNH